jgi:hypothetical protein
MKPPVNSGPFVSILNRNSLPPTNYLIVRKNSLYQFDIIHLSFMERKRGGLIPIGKDSNQFKDFLSGLGTVNV